MPNFAVDPSTLPGGLASLIGESTAIRLVSAAVLAADVAVVETTLHFSEGPLREERGTLVMVRQGGTWLIAAARVLPVEQR